MIEEKEERESLLRFSFRYGAKRDYGSCSSGDEGNDDGADEQDYGDVVGGYYCSTGNKRAKLIQTVTGRRVGRMTLSELRTHIAALEEIALAKHVAFPEKLLDRLTERHPLIRSYRTMGLHPRIAIRDALYWFSDGRWDELRARLGDEEFTKVYEQTVSATHHMDVEIRNRFIAEISEEELERKRCASEEVIVEVEERGFFSKLFRSGAGTQ